MKYLMVYPGNWNDEIEVDGFVIVEKEFVCYIKKFLKNFNNTISVDIGFKETVDYENGTELLLELSFDKITNNESETIEKYFGCSNDFGINLLMSIKESSERNDNNNVFIYK